MSLACDLPSHSPVDSSGHHVLIWAPSLRAAKAVKGEKVGEEVFSYGRCLCIPFKRCEAFG